MRSTPKVTVASYSFDPSTGGAATSALRLVEGLRRDGYEVGVLTSHPGRGLRRVAVAGASGWALPARNLYWVGAKDAQPAWKRVAWQGIDTWNAALYPTLVRVLRQERPDVLHVNKLRGISPAIWSAAKRVGTPVVVQTCRDYELISPEGTLTGRLGDWARLRRGPLRPYQALRARGSRLVDVVTAPSRYTLRTILDKGLFGRSAQHVVPNSHGAEEQELEARAREPLAGGAPRILFIGRLEPTKGVDVLAEAFVKVADRVPGFHLDIAGSGSMEPTLRRTYDMHPAITFHGHVSGDRKDDLLRRATVVAVPSTYEEIFGNVVVEAYSYGKPVIASRVGGLAEVIEEGAGWLVEPSDVDLLAQALASLPSRIREAGELRARCFAAASRYTLGSVTGQYLAVYDEALGRVADGGDRAEASAGGTR